MKPFPDLGKAAILIANIDYSATKMISLPGVGRDLRELTLFLGSLGYVVYQVKNSPNILVDVRKVMATIPESSLTHCQIFVSGANINLQP